MNVTGALPKCALRPLDAHRGAVDKFTVRRVRAERLRSDVSVCELALFFERVPPHERSVRASDAMSGSREPGGDGMRTVGSRERCG